MINGRDRLLVLLVIRLLIRTSRWLLIRVRGRINISWVLLIMAIMHHWLHGHPIGSLGIWGTKWDIWLNRCHLLISNWLTLSG